MHSSFSFPGLFGDIPSGGPEAGQIAEIDNHMMQVVHLIVRNHAMEIILVGLAFFAVVFALERLFSLCFVEWLMPARLLFAVDKASRAPQIDSAGQNMLRDECRVRDSAIGRVIEECLLQSGTPLPSISSIAKQTLAQEYTKANSIATHLSLIGKIGLLFGLLGTVMGMMAVYSQIGQSGAGTSGVIGQGLSSVLKATACGILVAIISFTASHLARSRLTALFGKMTKTINPLLPKLAK